MLCHFAYKIRILWSENMTFEKFKELFDGLTPDKYSNQIRSFYRYLEKIDHDFYEEYTYCTGCKQIVKRSDSYIEQGKSRTFNRSLVKCKKCNTTWYICDNDDSDE